MNWSVLKSLDRRLVVLTLAVVFGLANYWAVIPWWNRLREQGKELEKLRSEVNDRREEIWRADERRNELSLLTQENQGGTGHVESPEAWMKHFEELAVKSGVELGTRGSSQPKDEKDSAAKNEGEPAQRRSSHSKNKNRSNQLEVTCKFQGTLSAVARFLWTLTMDAAHPQVKVCQLAPVKPGDEKLTGKLILVVGLKPSP